MRAGWWLMLAGLVAMMGSARANELALVNKVPEGTLILRPFTNAAYPHPSRANGFTIGDKTFPYAGHYDDRTVGIFIPKNFRPGATTDYVIHFHGHMNHVEQVFKQYDLPAQFEKSGLNAILLVPQGPKDATDSGDGHLELDPGGLEALVHEVAEWLASSGYITSPAIGRVTLTAHSGGYKVVSAILQHGGLADNIRDVLLFDASYGNLDGFADWAKQGHGRRLISLFTPHLASANVLLMSILGPRHVKFRVVMDGDMTDADLRQRGVLFIHTTDLEHDQVVAKKDYFARFLKTGYSR